MRHMTSHHKIHNYDILVHVTAETPVQSMSRPARHDVRFLTCFQRMIFVSMHMSFWQSIMFSNTLLRGLLGQQATGPGQGQAGICIWQWA